jgi:hypothetical protein
LPRDERVLLMTPHKNARRLSIEDRESRARIASPDRIQVVRELVAAALQYVVGLLPGMANPARNTDARPADFARSPSAG